MSPTEVILVEDDVILRDGLKEYLELGGCAVTAVGSGLDCFMALTRQPTLRVAVIDLGLPDIDGQRIVEHLRQHTQIRIIVLTADNNRDARIGSYQAGADLYMNKPVDSGELVAAIISLGQRQASLASPSAEMESAGSCWQLNRLEWTLTCPNGAILRLTNREFQFMDQLASDKKAPLPRQVLCQALYQRHDASAEASLSTLVKRLRQRIDAIHNGDSPILTAHGSGYRFAGSLDLR